MVEDAADRGVTGAGPVPAIGFDTLARDFTGPGDRRRFCFYAARRGLAYERARPGRPYDVVVTTGGGDLSEWCRLPRRTRLVLDLVDSYLDAPRLDPRALVRGAAKFAFGHTRHLHLDYRALLERTCRRADAVVCATEEQRQTLLRYCPNVHVILDFQPEVESRVKPAYATSGVFKLVWEGLPENVATFRAIAPVLRDLRRRRPFELHLVTDRLRALGSTHIWMVPTERLAHDVLRLDGVHLHEWSQESLPAVALACDLAVIPIPLGNRLLAGKPENKLILFWRMALPVVTSATPAYLRTMGAAGLDMACRTDEEWTRTLERCMDDEAARRDAGRRGHEYAVKTFAVESLLRRWDDAFSSVR
jgi:glycosyltransferase involved in cell wall biosynthesis